MAFTGRLIFWEDRTDCDTAIKMGTYYIELPSNSTQFKNVIYLTDIEFQRSSFEINEFEEVDSLGISRQVGRTSIERVNIDLILNSNLLSYFNSIGAHSIIQLEIFEDVATPTTKSTLYRVDRIELSDRTGSKQVTGQVTLTLDIRPEIQTACCTEDLTVLSDFLAYWDTDNDGTPDIDGDAEHLIGSLGGEFSAFQLYYESDGITPLVSGDVEIVVKGVRQNGDSFVIGTFNGQFGDLLSDSSKWSSIYNVWDYFNLGNSIGHNSIVQFAKETFGFDKGFFGNETNDSAIDIQMFIAVNDSPSEGMTLPKVYTILSAYSNHRALKNQLKIVEDTVNKVNQQSSLIDYAETRTRLDTSVPTNFNAFALDNVNSIRKRYEISGLDTFESYSLINIETASNLIATQRKATQSFNDFSIGARSNVGIDHVETVLSTTSVRICTFFYQVLRQTDISPPFPPLTPTWPAMGALNTSGEWFQDGISQGFLNTSLGNNSRTSLTVAANTDIHTNKFQFIASSGREVSIEFQWRLHPKY